MKKDKTIMTITIGIVCFLLVMIIFMQFKVVQQSKEINVETETEFYNEEAMWETTAQNIRDFILEKITITESQYSKHNKQIWWFSAEDACKIHIANEICKSHFISQ